MLILAPTGRRQSWSNVELAHLRRSGRWMTSIEVHRAARAWYDTAKARGDYGPLPNASQGIECDTASRLLQMEKAGAVRGLRLGKREGVTVPVLWRPTAASGDSEGGGRG